MGEKLQPIVARQLHRGMADASVLSDAMMPAEQLRLIQNMDTDAIGFLTGRKGYTRLGNTAVVSGNSGLGLYHHVSSNSTKSKMVAFINEATDATCESYYFSSETWQKNTIGFTAGYKVRTKTFLDYLFAVNDINAPKTWDGTTGGAWGTTNLTDAPSGAGLIETYRQQVYMGNTSTDTIYFSSVPSTGGLISWTTTDNFICNPNDGANLTALVNYAQQLLIAKGNYIYRYNGSSVDSDPIIKWGISSQEAVKELGGVLWFYDGPRNSILGYSGGFPVVISKPFRSFLEAVPTSKYPDVSMRGDDDHVETFLGDLTVNGLPFVNVADRYVISTKTHVIRSYADEFTVFADYDDGTDLWNLGFTTDGNVVKMDEGNDDMGEPIQYILETPWLVISGNPAVLMTLSGFAAFAEKARGMNVLYSTDLDRTWRPIGQMKEYVTSWSGINIKFHKIRFRFVGSNNSEQAIFEGYSLLIPIVEGIEKDTKKLQ